MRAKLSDQIVATIKDGAARLSGLDKRAFQAKVTLDYLDEDLPTERTISGILNRLGFRLRRVQKTKPVKKIKETDAIFENVQRANHLTIANTIRSNGVGASWKCIGTERCSRTIETALQWAKTMTWKGTQPVVQLLDNVYKTGVRLTKAAFKPLQQRLARSTALPKWSVSIEPQSLSTDR